MKKRLFLFFLTGLEILAGLGVSWTYLQFKKNQSRVLGANLIAKIDQTKIIKNSDQELKYYWEYQPDEIVTDNPPWLKHTITYSINNDGLNDLKNYELEKPSQTYRIVALGDSFTFGHYVNTSENWTEILEKTLSAQPIENCNLNNIEVLNLGMPGFDVQEIVRRYERIGKKYQPDLVIWFESGTGFVRFNEITQPIIDECVVQTSTNSSKSQSIYDIYTDCSDLARSYLLEKYSQEQLLQQLELSIKNLLSSVNQDQLAFIYNDEGQDYKEKYLDKWQENYPLVSFSFPTLNLNEKAARLADGHPNQEGHQRIAKAAFDFILDHKLTCLK